MPLLRHATPARNVNAILRAGLLTGKSRGRLAAVWLCSPAKSSWAVHHVVKGHGGRVETTAVLEADVPRGWLRRSRKGLWYCPRDVPPSRLGPIRGFAQLAGAGAEVDDPVGLLHRLFVVLDHDQCVAEIAQPFERGDQS